MAMSVNVLSLARTYEEKNRVLTTWTSLVCDHPLDASVRLREKAWVMILASPSNSQDMSLVQVCYRLSPDVPCGFYSSQASQETENMTTFVLQKLGSVMHKNFVDMSSVYTDKRTCPQ